MLCIHFSSLPSSPFISHLSAYQSHIPSRSNSEVASFLVPFLAFSLTNWKSSPSATLCWPSSHVHLYYSYPNARFLSAFKLLAACCTSYVQLCLTQCPIHNVYKYVFVEWINEWISRTKAQIDLFSPFAAKISWPIVHRLLRKLLLQQVKIVWGQEALLEYMKLKTCPYSTC